MNDVLTYPAYTQQEARARETFMELMWAFAHPGRPQKLPITNDGVHEALMTIAETLLDLETSYFTPDALLAEQLHHAGARSLPANRAAYHFYPVVRHSDLEHIKTANQGSALYPDQSATLILGCQPESINAIDARTVLVLEGPGVQGQIPVAFSGIVGALWSLRNDVTAYPIGWDILIVDSMGSLIGIPRSTHVQIELLDE